MTDRYIIRTTGQTGASTAATVTIADTGAYFTGTTVEAALQEEAAARTALDTAVDARVPTRPVPSRLLAKLAAGTAITVSVMGDSIYQGSTATTPGTDDAVSLFCTHLHTTWGSTVSKQNRAQGGRTVWQEWVEKGSDLLADRADLYIIAMTGKNDAAYEAGYYYGQKRESSIAMLESIVREIMFRRPTADIIIASGNPYGYAGTVNTSQKAHSAALAKIAAAYDLPYADGWGVFPRETAGGDVADGTYLTDGVHPNSLGHAVLADELIACVPDTYTPARARSASVRAGLPPTTSVVPVYRTMAGTTTSTSAGTTANTDRLINPSFTGTWTSGSSAPWVSSTANAAAWIMAKCTDLFVDLKCGTSQGVVDLILDGTVVANNLDLSTYDDGKWLTVGQNMLPGVHHAEVRVVSGSVEIQGWGYNHAPCEFVPIDSSRITAASMGASSNLNQYYAIKSNQSANGASLTLDFIGTGVMIEASAPDNANPGYYFSSITVDGVALSSPTWPPMDSDSAASVALTGMTGLEYGKHTIVVTFQASGMYVGGFSVIDERVTERPDVCEGIAKVGETVRFAHRYASAPVVTVTSTTANVATASTVTTTSFLVGGTSGDVVYWLAVGPRAVA